MSEGTAAAAMRSIVRPGASSAPDTVVVKGRLGKARRSKNDYYTLVTRKARDEYSAPSVLEVKSTSPLGSVGDETEIECYLEGYTYGFKTRDGADAQRCVMSLVRVEH